MGTFNSKKPNQSDTFAGMNKYRDTNDQINDTDNSNPISEKGSQNSEKLGKCKRKYWVIIFIIAALVIAAVVVTIVIVIIRKKKPKKTKPIIPTPPSDILQTSIPIQPKTEIEQTYVSTIINTHISTAVIIPPKTNPVVDTTNTPDNTIPNIKRSTIPETIVIPSSQAESVPEPPTSIGALPSFDREFSFKNNVGDLKSISVVQKSIDESKFNNQLIRTNVTRDTNYHIFFLSEEDAPKKINIFTQKCIQVQ